MRRHTFTSTSIVRTYNAAVVLQALHRAGSCSRSHLTSVTHMSPATVSRITARLIEQGIVIEERVGNRNDTAAGIAATHRPRQRGTDVVAGCAHRYGTVHVQPRRLRRFG